MRGARRIGSGLRAVALVAWLVVGTAVVAAGQPTLDERVREVAAELRCPVCQNLSVADSPSEMAREMRGVIREQLAAGKSPEEVRAYFLAKYGDWILLSPRPRGIGLLVWLGPFAAALAGLAAAGAVVRQWSRRPARAVPPADPALVERVRREAFEEGAIAGDGEGPRSPREVERARLYDALRELAFDHAAGKLSDADYAEVRQAYEARAAAVLAALQAEPAAPTGAAEPAARPRPRSARPGGQGRPRAWRLAASVAFLLVFGVAVGTFLSASLRPRPGNGGSITGDFLTGTGPSGVSADSAAQTAQDGADPGRAAQAGMPAAVAAQVREYRARLDEDPRDVEALLGMGRLNLQRGNLGEAIDYFKRAIDVDPDQPEALAHLGLILVEGGHVEPALVAFERALARDPGHPLALWGQGLALYEGKQDYAGAIRAWERLLATGPSLGPGEADEVARRLLEARQKLAAARAGTAAPGDGAR